MKINKLRLKNINSFKGDQIEIDFSQDGSLGQAGIFIITGSTGAGKTTLLDAICVALYGRTPRLKDGKGVENLMTKHTNECFVEVDFEVDHTFYTSSWSLKKKKNKDEYNPVKMELSKMNGDGKEIIAEKKKQVLDKVQQVTKLGFEQFTKSMLLAQGEFTAFISAKENEKAELLEKITGTEIYSEISKKVYERHKLEKSKLETIQSQLEAKHHNLQESQSVEELENRIQFLEKEINGINQQLKENEKEKQWVQLYQELNDQITHSQKEIININQRKEQYQPQLNALEVFEKVKPLLPYYDQLQNKRKEVENKQFQIDDLEKQLSEINDVLSDLDKTIQTHQQEIQLFETESKIKLNKIEQAKEKDLLIENENQVLADSQKKMKGLEQQKEKLTNKMSQLVEEKNKLNQEIESLKKYHNKNLKDKEITQFLPLIEENINQIYSLKDKINSYEESLTRNTKEQVKKNKDLHDKNKAVQVNEDQLNQCEKELEDLKYQLDKILMNKSFEQFEQDSKTKEHQIQSYEQLIELARIINELDDSILSELNRKKENELQISKLKEELEDLENKINQDRENLELLEQLRDKERQIIKYEEDRKYLKEGEPCPLCGSTNHPFFEKTEINLNQTEQKIDSKKQELSKLESNIKANTIRITELETSLQNVTQRIDEKKKNRNEQQVKWDNLLQNKELDIKLTEHSQLEKEITTLKNEKSNLDKQINQIKEINLQSLDKKEQLNKFEKSRLTLESSVNTIQNELEHIKNELQRLSKEKQNLEMELNKVEQSVTKRMEDFHIANQTEINKGLTLLKQRSQRWIETEEKLTHLSTKINPIQEEIKSIEWQLVSITNSQVENQEQYESIKKRINQLILQREELIGQANPEEEKNKIKVEEQRLKDLGKQLNEQINQYHIKNESTKASLESKNNELNNLKLIVEKETKDFINKLQAIDIVTEEELKDNLLTEQEYEEYFQIRQDLVTSETNYKVQLEQSKNKLSELLKDKEEPEKNYLSSTIEKEDQLKSKRDDYLSEKGSINEKVNQHKNLLKEQSSLEQEKENQLKECSRWDKLNSLIGSADGKKFRNIAQKMTLNFLIEKANNILYKFTDRYLLNPDETQNLGLLIKDTYQADTIRPINTLSGGETFIVSLAMALGLSNMLSGNMKVDTLFLDEGFGTLDNDTLDTALSALNSIHAEGKLIGIISHIELLKERIPTQIKVYKKSGGYSYYEIV